MIIWGEQFSCCPTLFGQCFPWETKNNQGMHIIHVCIFEVVNRKCLWFYVYLSTVCVSVHLCIPPFLFSMTVPFLRNYKICICHEASLEKLESDVQFMALLGLHQNQPILGHFRDVVRRNDRKAGESKLAVICVVEAFSRWE